MTLQNGTKIQRKRKPRTVSRYNETVMIKLQKALNADPTVDLSAILSDGYTTRRNDIKLEEEEYQQQSVAVQTAQEVRPSSPSSAHHSSDPRMMTTPAALPQDVTKVIFELSNEAMTTLQLEEKDIQDGEIVTKALQSALSKSELLFSSSTTTYIFKCGPELVVKCFETQQAANGMDFTEYTSMQYLEQHIPDVPAPRPHGLLVSGSMAYIWMTHIPGETLEAAWPRLTTEHKSEICADLGKILDRLRAHEHSHTTLGGVQGEGCKDSRRATRISSKPLRSLATFWSFLYGSPTGPTSTFVQAIQSWIPPLSNERSVFTHGDLRPANIHVTKDKDQWYVTGLLDWEKSGFYPEWWEACKITNCMSPIDSWDWYLYLPTCVSPSMFPCQWLNDRFWDRYVVGQAGLIDIQ